MLSFDLNKKYVPNDNPLKTKNYSEYSIIISLYFSFVCLEILEINKNYASDCQFF